MKQSRTLFGNLGLLLMGGILSFPSPAHATMVPMYSPISFSNYSVVDTATTNVGTTNTNITQSQALVGPPPAGPQSGTVTQNNQTPSAPSSSSVTAGVNPTEILRTYPTQSTSPYISIAQTDTALSHAGLAHSLASANSVFSADFNGTGNLATLYATYFAGGISSDPHAGGDGDFDSFGSSLTLTIKNITTNTQIASLNVMGNANEGGSAIVNTSSGFILNQYTNGYPSTGPLFLDFATQSNAVYQISGDLQSNMGGSPANGGTGLATFDLVANTPEPSTIALFGTGILLMGFMGLRNRKGLLIKA